MTILLSVVCTVAAAAALRFLAYGRYIRPRAGFTVIVGAPEDTPCGLWAARYLYSDEEITDLDPTVLAAIQGLPIWLRQDGLLVATRYPLSSGVLAEAELGRLQQRVRLINGPERDGIVLLVPLAEEVH